MTDVASIPPSETNLATFPEAWTWRTPLVTVNFEEGVPVDLERLTEFGDIHSAAADRMQYGAE